jgi:hypothetical protein
MNGGDVLSLLNGKKFTRRCKASKAAWVTIEGVSRKGLKSGKFKYKKEDVIIMADSELEENNELVQALGLVGLHPLKNVPSLTSGKTESVVPLQMTPESA